MKGQEELYRLERAFTAAPPELAASVEAAFERGERAVKQRHKIMTAVSVVAALAVLFAALSLAAGQLVKPRVDSVAAARRDGRGASIEPTERPAPDDTTVEARETDIGDELVEVATSTGYALEADPPVYYGTLNGKYFHSAEHCGGMQNALPLSLNAAWAASKEPCPLCVDERTLPEAAYYATRYGKYYHVIGDCMGMKDAVRYTKAAAEGEGKAPCPVCLPAEPAYCWATPMGKYYHSERYCMGMMNARVYTEAYARSMDKSPCPTCWE